MIPESFDDIPNTPSVQNELIRLSLPAIAGQAIEPLAQLMETAYIGRLGQSLCVVVLLLNITRLCIVPPIEFSNFSGPALDSFYLF